MSEWKIRRFWTEATTMLEGDGFGIRLDARPLRTPAKAHLVVPTLALARAIAAEWQAQQGEVRPATMPLTRMANSAIDKVASLRGAVIDEVAGFGASDLLCYRAPGPEGLCARQVAVWDPVLDWAAGALGAPLRVTTGVVHVPQPATSQARLRARVEALCDFRLAALHDLVAISGSLLLGLAVFEQRLSPAHAWTASRIDDDWQAAQWGIDDEAAAAAVLRQTAFVDAASFAYLCSPATVGPC